MNLKLLWLSILMGLSASAQTNLLVVTNRPLDYRQPDPQPLVVQTRPAPSAAERAEQIRASCIEGRRSICGKILKVLPDGLVVESGYTNLLRSPLDRSWLVPGTAVASRAPNLVEGREPGAVCTGLVYLTDIPKSRRTSGAPKLYDYVIVQGYPAGFYTYNSVGTVERTVRRFSMGLQTAVNLTLAAETRTPAPATEVK